MKQLAKYGAMGAALAALAIIMLPGISFSQPHPNGVAQTTVKAEVPLTPQELEVCNSVHGQLDSTVIAGQNHTDAVDLLNGVYCNRADLVHAIGSSNYPATGLTAYACEATQGTISDQSASEELLQYKAIYCASASRALQNGTASIGDIVASMGQISDLSSKSAQVASILQNSTALAHAQRPYSAYLELDRATSMVTNSTS